MIWDDFLDVQIVYLEVEVIIVIVLAGPGERAPIEVFTAAHPDNNHPH